MSIAKSLDSIFPKNKVKLIILKIIPFCEDARHFYSAVRQALEIVINLQQQQYSSSSQSAQKSQQSNNFWWILLKLFIHFKLKMEHIKTLNNFIKTIIPPINIISNRKII
jgi:3-isopropylmalate dehydratase small subunit